MGKKQQQVKSKTKNRSSPDTKPHQSGSTILTILWNRYADNWLYIVAVIVAVFAIVATFFPYQSSYYNKSTPTPASERSMPNTNTDRSRSEGRHQVQPKRQECGIWMAESTIPNSGLGLFAGKRYVPTDDGQSMNIDPVIPLLDMDKSKQHDGTFLYYAYTWTAKEEATVSKEADFVQLAIPGFGASVNTHQNLINIGFGLPLEDIKTPRDGASTPYFRMSAPLKEIEPGEELFSSYGDDWLESHAQVETELESNEGRNSIYEQTRSLEWLERHGTCADNMRPMQSKKFGGRGAFATRPLAKGSAIAVMPLIHLPYKNKLEYGSGRYQLLLNYCFGHSQSTLLLCPYSPGTSYINHGGSAKNAKVQWSKDRPGVHDSKWLQLSVEELKNQSHSGLAFELVALSDIAKDEEIVIDYGTEWETAWNKVIHDMPQPHAGRDRQHGPYVSEIHSKNAFRQAMQIPDELMPTVWKNIEN